MKKIIKFVFAVLCITAMFPTAAYAYLDPGTATLLLQVLAGLALFVGIFWRFIIRFFKKIFGKVFGGKSKNESENQDNIIDRTNEL